MSFHFFTHSVTHYISPLCKAFTVLLFLDRVAQADLGLGMLLPQPPPVVLEEL